MFFNKHEHIFMLNPNGTTLSCVCGELKCTGHKWKDREDAIKNELGNTQIMLLRTCEYCGEIRNINITTGKKHD